MKVAVIGANGKYVSVEKEQDGLVGMQPRNSSAPSTTRHKRQRKLDTPAADVPPTRTVELGVNVNAVQHRNQNVFVVHKLVQSKHRKLHAVGTEKVVARVVSKGLTAARKMLGTPRDLSRVNSSFSAGPRHDRQVSQPHNATREADEPSVSSTDLSPSPSTSLSG
ncbi:unnamed protein product [Phytophthora lilii]|uniref:Unnamed protein product n=1 Tax=Phytophthora lilii TaxID=2077276 RepID=A0A9W6UB12_9STRA|nr:unnamed protein product [Phytophthora lilii]